MTTYQKGDAVIVRTPGGLWPGAVVGYMTHSVILTVPEMGL